MPRVLSLIGTTYLNKGELKKALKSSKKSLVLFKGNSIGIKIIKLWVFSNIGGIYYQQGDLDLAIEYYEKSVNTFEQENLTVEVCIVYDNLIKIFLDKNNPKQANEYLDRIQQYNEKIKNKGQYYGL